jgi:GTPase SAR1 family protein
VRSYKNLSDHDFEILVADLLGTDEGRHFEAFARGADRGVDLRFLDPDNSLHVVQCKHMEGSTYSQIRSKARLEAQKLSALTPQPKTYRFVTSHSLTAGNKTELRSILSPWIVSDSDIVGAEDLEILLGRHVEVERRHVKLWLSSFAHLDRAVNAATWSRSEQLLEEINESLPKFVDTGAFGLASDRLHRERVLILSGPPGIGKTTIARMLVADAVSRQYEPIEISADIEEASSVFDEHRQQIFIYDDFLGATFLNDRLSKNEDKRLANFLRRCRRSKKTLFVLTTREHILQQARSWYEELDRLDLPLQRLLIELKSYSRRERALILYNHLFHNSDLSSAQKKSITRKKGYLRIIDHANYNPRIVQFATVNFSTAPEGHTLLDFAIDNLDHPERIWEHAFTRQLDEDCRDLVLVLSTLPTTITVQRVQVMLTSMAKQRHRQIGPGALRQALRVLDDSFTRTANPSLTQPRIGIANPSVSDFAGSWLRSNPLDACYVLDGAVYFEQLEWLNTQVVRPSGSQAMGDAFDRALMRTFTAPPVAPWLDHPRISVPPEARLLAIKQMRSQVSSPGESPINAWWSDQIQYAAERWRTADLHDLPSALSLAALLHRDGHLGDKVASALTQAADAADSANDWGAVVGILNDAPDVFRENEVSFSASFQQWAEYRLVYSIEEVADLDEWHELENIASQLGVPTMNHIWDNAYDEISNRPIEDMPSNRSAPRAHVGEEEADDDEIERLFKRLNR